MASVQYLTMTFTEAQRAIYVDFECLGTKPPHLALLGMLVGSGDQQFEQIIIDERLAPARVASHRTRVAPAPVAAGELVARANAEDRSIVGWSLFDRDRLIEARSDLKGEITARYVNALQIARPWGRSLHPGVRIEREGRHSPKHTLDKYAALAAYPRVAALRSGEPARWIRHVLSQLKTTSGNYRQTTTETKRDWHKLLEYNRHDCLALRHIILKASRELECWRAYEQTRFCVDDGTRRICFTDGSKSAKLERLLERHHAARWAFLTAWNPASQELPPADNDTRQRELRGLLEAAGHKVLAGEGVGDDPRWKPEKSLMALGISRGAAVEFGRRFGQMAIVTGRRAGAARLISCARTPSAL